MRLEFSVYSPEGGETMSALRRTVVALLGVACIGQAGPASSEVPELRPSWVGESPQQITNWGYSAAGIGDVDGDGFSDAAIGAPNWWFTSPSIEQPGRITVYRGSPTGLLPTPFWSRYGPAFGLDSYGVGVAGADVNGDGFSDLIFSGGSESPHQIFAHHGSPSGPPLTENWSWEVPQTGLYGFGPVVAAAGDVNGDGYQDVVAGEPAFDSDAGLAVAFHGSPSGLGAAPAWWVQGDAADEQLGTRVAGAGDVNGDGYDDVLIGRSIPDVRVSLYYGSDTGLAAESAWDFPDAWSADGAGDVNGDGYDDIIVGDRGYSNGEYREGRAMIFFGSPTVPSNAPDWEYEPDLAEVDFGSSVSGAGDFDRDGYDDILVGAFGYPGDPPWTSEGAAFLFRGSPSGPEPVPVRMTSDHVLDSNYAATVSEAGDVNGDGYADFLVPAPAALGGMDEKVFAYHGMPSTATGAAGSVAAVAQPGFQPLTVRKVEGGAIELRWSESCQATDADYEVYEGAIGDFESHVPRICGTGASLSFTLVPAETDSYYLVVPRSADREGSYGKDHVGDERPRGPAACLPQEIVDCF
jgi:hypothetical protein